MWNKRNVWICAVTVAISVLVGCGGSDQQGTPDVATTQAAKTGVEAYKLAMEKPVTVSATQSPDGAQLTVQYAVIAICEAAGVPYQWEKSAQLAGDVCRQFVSPLKVSGVSGKQALTDVLTPLGVHYEIDDQGVYVTR